MDVITLAAAKSYTDKAVEGAGGTAGKNCQIKSITEITGGHRVTFAWYDDDQVIREDTMDVMDGVDGQDGADGHDGTNGQDGAPGQDGTDGVGISRIDFKEQDLSGNNVYTITLSDGSTYDFTAPKGAQGAPGQDGADGDDGAPGVGVPSGGTTGQVLKKKSGTDYDTEWGNAGGGSGGHTIKNDGVAMTARSGLDFVDFDMTDDSDGDKTVASSHLLTSSELNDIFSKLPGKKTDLPVMFDETGAEYVVGWYVTSQGKVPVYQKMVDLGAVPSGVNDGYTMNTGISNVDKFFVLHCISTSSYNQIIPYYTATSDVANNVAGIWHKANNTPVFKLYTSSDRSGFGHLLAVIQYTKTTDTPE
jgi:hypothetical protein